MQMGRTWSGVRPAVEASADGRLSRPHNLTFACRQPTARHSIFALSCHHRGDREDRQPPSIVRTAIAAATSGVNPTSDHDRGAKRFERGVQREPRCWRQQRPETVYKGTNYFWHAHL